MAVAVAVLLAVEKAVALMVARAVAGMVAVLGTSLRDTYVMYPYHESHENRALGSPECRPIRYLITTRIRMNPTYKHVELGREYLPHGNLMPLILRTNLFSEPNGNPVAIIALSIVLSIPSNLIA